MHPAGGGVGTNVVVRVISTLGCSIEAAQGRSVGKKCELYFDWQGAQMGAEAQVVWRDEVGRMGLKFLSVDKDTQKRLSALCASLRAQAVAGPLPKDTDTAPPVLDSATVRQPAPLSRSAGPATGRERRRVPRYVSELPAHLSNSDTGATSSVTLVTLSVSGGCIEGRELPEAGQKCELNIEWEGKQLVVQGDVVWKGKEQVGVKFASLDEGPEKLLRQICANLRLQPLAPLPPEHK